MPIAIEFAKHSKVIGFDVDQKKIESLKNRIDPTESISQEDLKASSMIITDDPSQIREASFIIICVPTPLTNDKKPDHSYVGPG